MRALQSYMGIEDEKLSDHKIILLRLLGRHFSKPIDVSGGEAPEEVLVSYLRLCRANSARDKFYRHYDHIGPFLTLLAELIGCNSECTESSNDLAIILKELTEEDRCALGVRLIRVIEEAGIVVDENRLQAFALRLNEIPKSIYLVAYWSLFMSKVVSDIHDHQLPMSLKSFLDKDFLRGPIYALASNRPYLFFNTVLPVIFESLQLKRISSNDIRSFLPTAALAAFKNLYIKKHKDTRVRAIEKLAKEVELLVKNGRHTSIADLLISSAAEAASNSFCANKSNLDTMPFSDLQVIETGFAFGKFQAKKSHLNRSKGIDDVLNKQIQSLTELRREIAGTKDADPSLVTNRLPYSEGVYFGIWKEILKRVDIQITFDDIPWGEVIPALVGDRVSFAIWNTYAPSSVVNDGVEICAYYNGNGNDNDNASLLKYKNYPIVVRRDVIYQVLRDLPDEECEILRPALLQGSALNFDAFRACTELSKQLLNRKVGFVKDTDLEEAASLAGLNSHSKSVRSKHRDSTECTVGDLVEGKIAAAILGGLQASYLKRRFSDDLIFITEVPIEKPVKLWFNSEFYSNRHYSKLNPLLGEAWFITVSIWNQVCKEIKEKNGNTLLRHWVESIAFETNLGLKAGLDSSLTQISGIQEIIDLSRHHNILIERPCFPSKDVGKNTITLRQSKPSLGRRH